MIDNQFLDYWEDRVRNISYYELNDKTTVLSEKQISGFVYNITSQAFIKVNEGGVKIINEILDNKKMIDEMTDEALSDILFVGETYQSISQFKLWKKCSNDVSVRNQLLDATKYILEKILHFYGQIVELVENVEALNRGEAISEPVSEIEIEEIEEIELGSVS